MEQNNREPSCYCGLVDHQHIHKLCEHLYMPYEWEYVYGWVEKRWKNSNERGSQYDVAKQCLKKLICQKCLEIREL